MNQKLLCVDTCCEKGTAQKRICDECLALQDDYAEMYSEEKPNNKVVDFFMGIAFVVLAFLDDFIFEAIRDD
jgi:hypothetical protein